MNDRPSIVITIGAPGSGKSTWVQNYKKLNPQTKTFSSDQLRSVFGKDENDQSVSKIVFEHIRNEVEKCLRENVSVCIDATNMHLKARKPWVDLSKKYNVDIKAYVFIEDRSILIDRNINRGRMGGRNVPVEIIDRMLNNYYPPSFLEGFKDIFYV